MRCRLLLLGVIIMATAEQRLHAQAGTHNRAGSWVGVTSDNRMEIIFHLTISDDQQYEGTWDSPIEKVMGLKCKSVVVSGDSIHIETAGVKAFYQGVFLKNDSIDGVWIQNGHRLPLDCKKIKRPQTPLPPFSYIVDSVEYDNADKSVHLGATLTRPEKKKRYPAVILITGSGLQDRDENLFEHRPFAIIADYLTRQGLAVLRVDDRMKGKSKGDIKNATSADFAGDILTSIHYLSTRDDIDTTRIGLIGHSEGGLIAPMVAVKWPGIRWIVMLAGPGVPGSAISLKQQMDAIGKMNFSEPALNAYATLTQNKMDTLNRYYGQPDSLAINGLKHYFDQWKKDYPDSVLAPLGALQATGDLFALQVAGSEMKPWTRYFYKTDPAIFLQQVQCPVLILNGEKDKQVYPSQNIPAIEAALQKGGNKKYTTIVFPSLNHLFQHCQTGDFAEYAVIDESFSPAVLKEMSQWINKNE